MKNTRLSSILSSGLIACALSLGSIASTPFASAQGLNTTAAEVNIPFAFQTTTHTLPAGKYRIVQESRNVIWLQGSSTGAFAVTYDAVASKAPTHGSVVFNKYGDKYYLHEIWTAGNTVGLECPKSRAEKESKSQLAKNAEAPSSVELALNYVPKR
jgi:hypothetical protein